MPERSTADTPNLVEIPLEAVEAAIAAIGGRSKIRPCVPDMIRAALPFLSGGSGEVPALKQENERLRALYENVVQNRERFGWTINHLLECEEALRTAEAGEVPAGLTREEAEALTAVFWRAAGFASRDEWMAASESGRAKLRAALRGQGLTREEAEAMLGRIELVYERTMPGPRDACRDRVLEIVAEARTALRGQEEQG